MSRRESSRAPAPDAGAIVSALNERNVRFVVIGAFAAIAQGAPIPATRDLDITPEGSVENCNRLSEALKRLNARIRTGADADGVAFDHDGASLRRAATWNLICRHGEFDICFRPAAFEDGYAGLVAGARRVNVEGIQLCVADLHDVIRSKESAGRPKDIRVLPALYRFHARRAGGVSRSRADGSASDRTDSRG